MSGLLSLPLERRETALGLSLVSTRPEKKNPMHTKKNGPCPFGIKKKNGNVIHKRGVSVSPFGGLFSPEGAFLLVVVGVLALRGAWWGFHVEHAVFEHALAALESSFA